jgi:hypothetical protein
LSPNGCHNTNKNNNIVVPLFLLLLLPLTVGATTVDTTTTTTMSTTKTVKKSNRNVSSPPSSQEELLLPKPSSQRINFVEYIKAKGYTVEITEAKKPPPPRPERIEESGSCQSKQMESHGCDLPTLEDMPSATTTVATTTTTAANVTFNRNVTLPSVDTSPMIVVATGSLFSLQQDEHHQQQQQQGDVIIVPKSKVEVSTTLVKQKVPDSSPPKPLFSTTTSTSTTSTCKTSSSWFLSLEKRAKKRNGTTPSPRRPPRPPSRSRSRSSNGSTNSASIQTIFQDLRQPESPTPTLPTPSLKVQDTKNRPRVVVVAVAATTNQNRPPVPPPVPPPLLDIPPMANRNKEESLPTTLSSLLTDSTHDKNYITTPPLPPPSPTARWPLSSGTAPQSLSPSPHHVVRGRYHHEWLPLPPPPPPSLLQEDQQQQQQQEEQRKRVRRDDERHHQYLGYLSDRNRVTTNDDFHSLHYYWTMTRTLDSPMPPPPTPPQYVPPFPPPSVWMIPNHPNGSRYLPPPPPLPPPPLLPLGSQNYDDCFSKNAPSCTTPTTATTQASTASPRSIHWSDSKEKECVTHESAPGDLKPSGNHADADVVARSDSCCSTSSSSTTVSQHQVDTAPMRTTTLRTQSRTHPWSFDLPTITTANKNSKADSATNKVSPNTDTGIQMSLIYNNKSNINNNDANSSSSCKDSRSTTNSILTSHESHIDDSKTCTHDGQPIATTSLVVVAKETPLLWKDPLPFSSSSTTSSVCCRCLFVWAQGHNNNKSDNIILVVPSPIPPSDYVRLSYAALVLFPPLGICALFHSKLVYPAWKDGRPEDALYHAHEAQTFANCAILISMLIWLYLILGWRVY